MKEILKPIFEFVFNQFQIFENPFYNYFGMLIIGIIAFQIAWDISPGGKWGSFIHWTVRIITVTVLVTIISFTFMLIKWIISIPVWVWISALTIIITFFIVILARKKKIERINQVNKEPKGE